KDSGEFFQNKKEINYVGVSNDGGKSILQYDGHAGYDFPYSLLTPVIAPASGNLRKATKGRDLIYGASWEKDHSFYIEHENGFVSWFRHCVKLTDEIESQMGGDYEKSFFVEQGTLIAFSGDFENWKVRGTSAHLHFEVRNSKGHITDPYAENLWLD
ncbi:MAG: M23 family metallopeptidase, partial [Patescibacteria group bacterium]